MKKERAGPKYALNHEQRARQGGTECLSKQTLSRQKNKLFRAQDSNFLLRATLGSKLFRV